MFIPKYWLMRGLCVIQTYNPFPNKCWWTKNEDHSEDRTHNFGIESQHAPHSATHTITVKLTKRLGHFSSNQYWWKKKTTVRKSLPLNHSSFRLYDKIQIPYSPVGIYFCKRYGQKCSSLWYFRLLAVCFHMLPMLSLLQQLVKSTEVHKGMLNTLKKIKNFRNEWGQEIKQPFLLSPDIGGVLRDTV